MTYSYEDKSDIIDNELRKRVKRWHLYAVSWFNYDDVCQKIRLHIYTKWDQWDQTRPIEPWVNTIITRQIWNELRNNYSNFARPCISCKWNQSKEREEGQIDNLCGLTKSGAQSNECDKFAKWEKTKKHKYNVKMPLSFSLHFNDNYTNPDDHLDVDEAAIKLHKRMRDTLNDKHFFIYKMLFIDGLDDSEVAKILGYKSGENGRKDGYKQIKNLKNHYKKIAKKICNKEDMFY